MEHKRLGLTWRALALAARQTLLPQRTLPVTHLKRLFSDLPPDFTITVADVGSIGGLHRRWRPIRRQLIRVSFDPLQKTPPAPREHVFPHLIGDSRKPARLMVTRRASMSSTLPPNHRFFAPFWNKPADIEVVETIDAQMATLDEVVEGEGLIPHAIKIDVQGGEAAVLEGASNVLGTSALLVEVECSFADRYCGMETFDQIIARMRALGFALLDLRRLKRYRYANRFGIDDVSLGRGMRAGQLAFCDAIFILEPDRLWEKVGSDDTDTGLRAVVLLLIYGKPDLAATTFERVEDRLPDNTRAAFDAFFRSLTVDGDRRHHLHQVFDDWARRV